MKGGRRIGWSLPTDQLLHTALRALVDLRCPAAGRQCQQASAVMALCTVAVDNEAEEVDRVDSVMYLPTPGAEWRAM